MFTMQEKEALLKRLDDIEDLLGQTMGKLDARIDQIKQLESRLAGLEE